MTDINTLADRYADLKAELEGVQRLLDECKAQIKATGREEIIGARSIVTLGLSERTTIDQKLVKEILTTEQLAACSKTSLIETVRVKAIKHPQTVV
jgi:hypothetical protein